jgi:hypothetical protein
MLFVFVVICPGQLSAENLHSAPAKKALENYQTEVNRLNTLYEKAVANAKKKCVEELESARKTALIKSDLDEAQRIVAKKKELDESNPQPKAKEKTPWLLGTTWKEGGAIRRWLPDGLEVSGKIIADWMMLDDNRAIVWGKDGSYVTLFVFSPDKRNFQLINYALARRGAGIRVK